MELRPRLTKAYNRLDPSETQALIKILDIDDHLPQFESVNMTIGVRLNVPIDTVIATVKGTDKDPDALPIQYKFVNMSFESPIRSRSSNNISDVITLNNHTGELRVMKNLIHYADGMFRLTVRANNSVYPERVSEAMVEIAWRHLLRLVVGARRVPALRARVAAAVAPKGLRVQLHEVAAFHDSQGPCFQFRKTESGEALTPKAMKAVVRSLGTEFQDIPQTFDVHNITSCGESRATHTPAQTALLALAGVLPIAAFIATLVLCCMHSNAKQRARSALLLSREPPAAPSNASGPTLIYTEPLYRT